MHYGHVVDYICNYGGYKCNLCDKFAPILFIVNGLTRCFI